VAVERRADPAIALDRHIQIIARESVSDRCQQRERVVALGQRRKESWKPGADLTGESRDAVGLGAFTKLARASRNLCALPRRCGVVIVEPEQIDHAAHATRVERSQSFADR
jgi:hypothetical protein